VFAFEPYRATFQVLSRNVTRKGLTNVVLEQRAVGDEAGCVTMHIGAPSMWRPGPSNAGDCGALAVAGQLLGAVAYNVARLVTSGGA